MLGKLTNKQIEELMAASHIGHIGCCNDGKPYVVPVNYVYDDGSVFCHSGEGLKIEIMRKNPHICFQVDRIKDMVNWESVIAHGLFEEVIRLEGKQRGSKKSATASCRSSKKRIAIPRMGSLPQTAISATRWNW